MTKKEYILKLSELIINRVTFHAPKANQEIDYALLSALQIDTSLPIFVFDKKLDRIYYKAFSQAKKKVLFNLILTQQPILSRKKVENLKYTYIILKDEMGSVLFNSIDALNVNYLSHTDFKTELQGENLCINNKKVDFDYLPYYYTKKAIYNGIIADIKSYILNGKNYYLTFTNTRSEKGDIEFQFNLPLPRGYYSYKKGNNFIEIESLSNKDKAYFNFNFNGGLFTFSNLNGLESSTFACVNLKCRLSLLGKECKKVYFNFGKNKFCLNSPRDMKNFYELSQKMMCKIFDLKITTHDSKFDNQLNLSLPRKIWEKWQKFDVDEESENKYLKLKNLILKKQENGIQISQDFQGLKEVQIYRNDAWKKVFVMHNDSCFMFADKVKYFNYTLLTKEIFDKNNEIYLSFSK